MAKNEQHVVYMLRCKDGSVYTGYTNRLVNRLRLHQTGKGAKYTKGRGPFILLRVQQFTTKQEAMREEYRIKRLTTAEKWRIIRHYRKGTADADAEKL